MPPMIIYSLLEESLYEITMLLMVKWACPITSGYDNRELAEAEPVYLSDFASVFTAPILKVFVPHFEHSPEVAGLPLLIVTGVGFFISVLALHFMQ